MKFSVKEGWNLAKGAVASWREDYASSMGAALSYYTLFSIAPLLLIVIAVAGFAFGEEAARGEIVAQLGGLMGADAAKAIENLIVSVDKPGKGLLSTIIGVLVLFIGATTVFGELQDALDRIWRAPAREPSGLWGLIRARVLSFGLILAVGFLLIASLVFSAALSALGKWWAPFFGAWGVLLQGVNFAASFGLITVMFALIYKIMPRVRIEWHDVWIGAAVTALLFTIGKFLIGLYIGKSSVASGFGAAGSLVVVLIWVYYSAQIFLLGAEFTWVYAHRHGSLKDQPVPGRDGVPAATRGGAAAPAGQMQPAAEAPASAAAAAPQPVADAVPEPSAGFPRPVSTRPLRGPLRGLGIVVALGMMLHWLVRHPARPTLRRVHR